jgi:orotidine-5'-phosphate decarboxylase
MRDKICVALDVPSPEAIQLIEKLNGKVGWCKIGPALLTTEDGLRLAVFAKDHGFKTFLDFKFKDIPSVVTKGIKNLHGIADLITVHIDGGITMLKEAKQAAGDNIKIIGVTLLTSLGRQDLEDFGYDNSRTSEVQVIQMTHLAIKSGIDGIVCSAQELGRVKANNSQLFCVTPGLKMPQGDDHEDQARTGNPRWAYQQGSDLLVMGRDIYEAKDPVKQVESIVKLCLGN